MNTQKLLSVAIGFGMVVAFGSGAMAQTPAEPGYKASPDVYKVIFEDSDFRIIQGTRKKGVHDKPHGHPVPYAIYNVTDCKTKVYDADGKTRETASKGGTAQGGKVTPSHSAENIGDADCVQVFVEKK